jgi:hypothetical protein
VKTKSFVQGKKQAYSLYFRKDEHNEKRWTNGRTCTIKNHGALNRYNTRRDEGGHQGRAAGVCVFVHVSAADEPAALVGTITFGALVYECYRPFG